MPEINIPAGNRLVLITEEVADMMGTRTEDGDRLSFSWGTTDEQGISELVVTRHPYELPEDEVLFMTSNDRILEAFQRCYPNDPALALEMTRHLMRRLTVPSVEEVRAYQEYHQSDR